MTHRARIRRDDRGLWWWWCPRCPEYSGHGNVWHRIVSAASRHVQERHSSG